MDVESGILDFIQVLEIAIDLMFSAGTKDFSQDFGELAQSVWIVGEAEFTGQVVGFDQVVHGNHSRLATVEQYGSLNVGGMA